MFHLNRFAHTTSIKAKSIALPPCRHIMLAWIGSWFEPGVKKGTRSIFEFTVDDISGSPVDLSTMRGKKAYLVVNVASK